MRPLRDPLLAWTGIVSLGAMVLWCVGYGVYKVVVWVVGA